MCAARYIGRVGGLAVALGVGAAVFTGYGVAWAEPGSSGSSSSGSSSQSSSSSGSAGSGSANSGRSVASRIASALKAARSTGAGSSSDTATPSGSTTSGLPGVVVSTGGALSSALSGAKASGGAGVAGGLKLPKTLLSAGSAPAAGEPSVAPARSAASSPTSSPAATDTAASGSTVSANEVVVQPPSVSALLAVPRIAASNVRTAASTLASVAAPPNTLIAGASLVTMQPATPTPAATVPAKASTILATVVTEVLNPFAGNAPTGPVDPPTSWVLLAAVRREFSGAAVSLDPASPITTDPTLTFDDGIVYGNANATDANGLPLAYTIVSDPNQGGKITFVPELAAGTFTYLPYQTVLTGTDEQFSELVSETTPFDASLEALPVVGGLVQPVLVRIYQVPVLSTALAPLIGSSVIVTFDSSEVPQLTSGVPAAFTVKVISFDGTPISTNFYPAPEADLAANGGTAPTIFEGPGLASPGATDPNAEFGIGGTTPGIAPLRADGYNVVTWDPRGEFASGGLLNLDSPAFEGRDVSALITWDAQLPETQLDGPNDPRMGMVGGSYGGGIQLVAAGIDPRIDAIVPAIAWNSLNASLYPDQLAPNSVGANGAFKTSFATLLLLGLVETGARINPQLYGGIVTGDLLGILTPGQQALLAASGPDFLLNNITAPTLLIQGTVDVLFPLQQAVTNGAVISANGVPVKEIWFCGGHGTCQNPASPIQDQIILGDTLAWLDQYVKQDPSDPADAIPTFQWVDQTGQFYSSDLLPSDPNFDGTPIDTTGTGGRLLLVPVVGGSGPSTAPLPQALGDGAKAKNAVNLTTAPIAAGTQIVGAPELTMTYSGVGTSRFVYAQIVDDNTGQVVGHVVTPIPVTLNGQTQTVTVPLDDIAYTAPVGETDTLTLQITSSATAFENFTSFGTINITSVQLSLPTVGADANATPENSAPAIPTEMATVA